MSGRSATDLVSSADGDITPDELTSTGGVVSTYLYTDPLIDLLDESEQPQYCRRAEKLVKFDSGEKNTDADTGVDNSVQKIPDEIDGRAYVLITNTRLLYIAGCADGDVVQSFAYDNLLDVRIESAGSTGSLWWRTPMHTVVTRTVEGTEFRTQIHGESEQLNSYITSRIESLGGANILHDEIKQIAQKIGHIPSSADVIKYGVYPSAGYASSCGSIETAIAATDLSTFATTQLAEAVTAAIDLCTIMTQQEPERTSPESVPSETKTPAPSREESIDSDTTSKTEPVRDIETNASSGERQSESADDVSNTADSESLRETLITELTAIDMQLDRPVAPYHIAMHGSHTATQYQHVFGSWDNAGDIADVRLKSPSWRDAVRDELRWYRTTSNTAVVTLNELYDAMEIHLKLLFPDNNNIRAKIRQQLQRLRDDGDIEFRDARGTYRILCDPIQSIDITIDEQQQRAKPTSHNDVTETSTQTKGSARGDLDLVTGLIWSATKSRKNAKTALEDGLFDRAEWQLWGAYGMLERAATIADETDDSVRRIAANKYQISRTFNDVETSAMEKHREHVDQAEAAVTRGIEARDRGEYLNALDAFTTAKDQYVTAVDIATAQGLPTKWETEQRYSMVSEYVATTEEICSEQQDNINSALDTVHKSLTKTEQYIEVKDVVAARESLAEVRTTLDTIKTQLSMSAADDAHKQQYEAARERLSTAQSALESLSDNKTDKTEYRRQDLISSLQMLATTIDESPRPELIDLCGDYPADAYINAFGSWSGALDTANIDQIDEVARNRRKYTRVEVLDALVDVIEQFGREPSRAKMNTHGAVSSTTVVNRFGNWEKAVELATDVADDDIEQDPEPNQQASDAVDNKSSGDIDGVTDSTLSGGDQEAAFSETTTVTQTTSDEYATIDTIESNGRFDRPIPVKVRAVSDTERSRRRETVHIEDLTGSQTDLNVWETHDVTVEWTPGEWYILDEALGKLWTNSNDETTRNLSTTADFTVTRVSERPSKGDARPGTTESTGGSDATTTTDTTESTEETTPDPSEIDILNEIERELNGL
ncbi:homing endonuclease associated repeat-containing protein [Haloquadratum walsbyi]|nr:hypothetical protein [Haloquadratum walsbyi]